MTIRDGGADETVADADVGEIKAAIKEELQGFREDMHAGFDGQLKQLIGVAASAEGVAMKREGRTVAVSQLKAGMLVVVAGQGVMRVHPEFKPDGHVCLMETPMGYTYYASREQVRGEASDDFLQFHIEQLAAAGMEAPAAAVERWFEARKKGERSC